MLDYCAKCKRCHDDGLRDDEECNFYGEPFGCNHPNRGYTNADEEILPCPFCGSKRTHAYKAEVGYSLICEDCAYCAGSADTMSDIIAAHNRVAKAVKESEVR